MKTMYANMRFEETTLPGCKTRVFECRNHNGVFFGKIQWCATGHIWETYFEPQTDCVLAFGYVTDIRDFMLYLVGEPAQQAAVAQAQAPRVSTGGKMKIKSGTQFTRVQSGGRVVTYTVAVCGTGSGSMACLRDSVLRSYTGCIHAVDDGSDIQLEELVSMMGHQPALFTLVAPKASPEQVELQPETGSEPPMPVAPSGYKFLRVASSSDDCLWVYSVDGLIRCALSEAPNTPGYAGRFDAWGFRMTTDPMWRDKNGHNWANYSANRPDRKRVRPAFVMVAIQDGGTQAPPPPPPPRSVRRIKESRDRE